MMQGLKRYSKSILRNSGSAIKEPGANSDSAICNLPLDVYLEILLSLDFGDLSALRKVSSRIFLLCHCIPHFIPDSVVERCSTSSRNHASGPF